MNPGKRLYDLLHDCNSELGCHVLSNAMLHVNGWWDPRYSRSPLQDFYMGQGPNKQGLGLLHCDG
jgi:hypothetical protein